MSGVVACPGCIAGPPPAPRVRAANERDLLISLPSIHCAGCIGTVEGTLKAVPGITSARVNLARRRVCVTLPADADAAPAITALQDAGFEAHELDEASLVPADAAGRLLLARIAVAGFAMMNVMALSVAVWSGAGEATRALFHWISAAVALPALAFSAVPFFTSAWGALRGGRVNMDVPIAVAIALAATSSIYETLTGSGSDAWFDAALSLTFFLLAGRYLDHRARASARSAAAELTALELARATVLEGTVRRIVDVADLGPGDVVALAPGARAPVDGVALGAATVDRSALTGESAPLTLRVGDVIVSGDCLLDSPVTMRATASAQDSTLRRIAALVDVAESGRHRYSGIADRAARLYAPLVHGLGALAFAGWYAMTGDLHLALAVATSVLIITCPCALGLAVPAVTTSMTARLFRAGVLLKSATALERLAQVDTILLDKTGTLTEGVPDLRHLDREAAGIALALARASDHPVSRAIARTLADVDVTAVGELREVTGEGVYGSTPNGPVFLGRSDAGTVLRLPGRSLPLRLTEHLRPGVEEMITTLIGDGYEVRLVTGDRREAAEAMARRLGNIAVHAQLDPEAKGALVSELTAQGRCVLMIGDGLNDTLALRRAHASMAPASALDVARVASDAVILTGDLGAVPRCLVVARTANSRIRQNLGLAAGYNILAIPIALAGFATPLAAAIAMSISSLTVALNAVRR